MFDLLNRRIGWNDKSTTEFSSDDLNEVLSMALEYSKKHKAVPVLLCGSITENYDSFLNNLAVQMFNCGIIDDQTVEKKGLLQILSGDMPASAFVREIARADKVNRKLKYISSFHQMEYDMHKAVSLLNQLQSLMINGQLLSPVVLNIPMGVDQTIRDICPELWNNSIRYMKKSRYSIYDYRYQSAVNAVQYAKEKREIEEVEQPWYKKNLELFKTEKDGMAMLLKNYNSLQIDMAALPQSKRLYWKFIMRSVFKNIRDDLRLRIVYPESFSEKCLDVGIVIENLDEKWMYAISRSELCKKTIYSDSEFDRMFIIRRVYKGNNGSSAAAAFEGLVDLLYSLN